MNESEHLKRVREIVTNGIAAIRRGTFTGEDATTIAEILIFLRGVSGDLKRDIAKKEMEVPMPMAEFKKPEPAP